MHALRLLCLLAAIAALDARSAKAKKVPAQARPGRLRALKHPWRFSVCIGFVWGFCAGARGV
jgi:hypothetical protein